MRELSLLGSSLLTFMIACSAGGGSPGAGGRSSGNGGAGGNPVAFGGSGASISLGGRMSDPGELPKATCSMDCTDFPEQPVLDGDVPSNAPALFGPADNFGSGGPCVLEPQLSTDTTPGALLPANWLRPRFRFTATGDLFEIRIHSAVQRHEFVAYTRSTTYTLPEMVWKAAAPNNAGKPMTVTIRAVSSAAPGTPTGVRGDINIAPVNAGGSMVFWTVTTSAVGPESSKLMGFSVGEEGVVQALAPKTVQFTGMIHEEGRDLRGTYDMKPGFAPGEVQCIGCHTSTPDGSAVVFTDDFPWNKAIASVEKSTLGAVPPYISPGARALLKMPWLGTQSMSAAHWSPGDRLLISGYGARTLPFSAYGQTDSLIWIDLETPAAISDEIPPDMNGAKEMAKLARDTAIQSAKGTAWDVFAMDGETAHAVTPDISNAGDKIVYVSTDASPNGHPSYTAQRADLKTLPFNNRKGGAATAVPGASDPAFYEYYPSFSPDDKLITFARSPHRGTCQNCPDGPYYNRFGEVNVIPAAGGTPTPLLANQPVACAGDVMGNGLINSWPKWSPSAITVEGKTYYFLIFSSARKYPGQFDIPRNQYTPSTLDTRSSQLYMAAVVVDENNQVTSYPAVYLWNQNQLVAGDELVQLTTSNLTPAWDNFKIPPVVIPPVR